MHRSPLLRRILNPALGGLALGVICFAAAGVTSWALDGYLQARERSARQVNSDPVQVGQPAFDFRLPDLDGGEVTLSDHIGRPVVLFFGSFTCTAFCRELDAVERLYHSSRDKAVFYFVNIREGGHRIDGFEFLLNDLQPGRSFVDRRRNIREAVRRKGVTLPVLIEPPQSVVLRKYNASPRRCVVIDAGGRFAMDLKWAVEPGESWDLDAVRAWLDRNVATRGASTGGK